MGGAETNGSHACFLEIRNPKIPENDLRWIMNHLGPTREPATFWTEIANNPRYSNRHRAYCVLQYFRRHVRAGTTLGELGKSLQGANWLRKDRIHEFPVLGGHVPLAWDPLTWSFLPFTWTGILRLARFIFPWQNQ
jgi:hypothetical protein